MLPDLSGLHVQCRYVYSIQLPLNQAGGPSFRDCIEDSIYSLVSFCRRKPNLKLAVIGCDANQMNLLHGPISTRVGFGFLELDRSRRGN
jgi:hypothetical protein